MHSGIHLNDWRHPYEFIPLFWINISLLQFTSNTLYPDIDASLFFYVKIAACIAGGVVYDYLPTKQYLLFIYLIGISAAFWPIESIALVSAGTEVLMLSYFSEVVVDNCKFTALAEVLCFDAVFGALGKLLSHFFSPISELFIFFPVTCFVLLIVNLALFQDVPKLKRPLFVSQDSVVAIPRPFGFFICALVLITESYHRSLLASMMSGDSLGEVLFYLETIALVPLMFFIVLKFFSYKKIIIVLVFFLAGGLAFWACLGWLYTVQVGLAGVVVSSAYCRCAGLVIQSRVLGPFYNGKFIGLATAFQYLFMVVQIEDWIFRYVIGLFLSIASIACLVPGMKYCDYHRDYIIGYRDLDNQEKKKTQYKIKLQRASVFDNTN